MIESIEDPLRIDGIFECGRMGVAVYLPDQEEGPKICVSIAPPGKGAPMLPFVMTVNQARELGEMLTRTLEHFQQEVN